MRCRLSPRIYNDNRTIHENYLRRFRASFGCERKLTVRLRENSLSFPTACSREETPPFVRANRAALQEILRLKFQEQFAEIKKRTTRPQQHCCKSSKHHPTQWLGA